MIEHITKLTWRQPDGKMGYCYHVHYARTRGRYNGVHRCFSWNENLPLTVVRFLLNAECRTEYLPNGNKREIYTVGK